LYYVCDVESLYNLCEKIVYFGRGERRKKIYQELKKRNLGILGSQINSKTPNNSKPTYLAKRKKTKFADMAAM
jgi:hypothetical protein